MRRRFALLASSVATLAALLAPAAAHAQPQAPASPPAVVLSYYSAGDLKRIVGLLDRAGLPAGTPVWYGNYYGTAPPRKPGTKRKPPLPPVAVPNGHQAPIFPWAPSKFWNGRVLPANQRRLVRGGLTGAAPPLARLLAGPASRRLAWGRELGQRFRDRVRAVEAKKGATPIDGWQFDEIPANAVGPQGRPIRELVRGILSGLHDGRPELGDKPEPGIVYMANHALALTALGDSPELHAFWQAIDATTSMFVGEEYAKFAGDPERAAFVQGAGQRHLAASGDAAMRSLASKYVVGVTPGYLPAINLGGNTDNKSPDGVAAWRATFLAARARSGIAGFASYNLQKRNRGSGVLGAMLNGFGEALSQYLPTSGGSG